MTEQPLNVQCMPGRQSPPRLQASSKIPRITSQGMVVQTHDGRQVKNKIIFILHSLLSHTTPLIESISCNAQKQKQKQKLKQKPINQTKKTHTHIHKIMLSYDQLSLLYIHTVGQLRGLREHLAEKDSEISELRRQLNEALATNSRQLSSPHQHHQQPPPPPHRPESGAGTRPERATAPSPPLTTIQPSMPTTTMDAATQQSSGGNGRATGLPTTTTTTSSSSLSSSLQHLMTTYGSQWWQ